MQWYEQHQYYNIYMLNDVLNEKYAKSERITLNLEHRLGALSCYLQMFWCQWEWRNNGCVLWFKGEEQKVLFWICEGFSCFLFSLLANLSLKASPLQVWWSNLFKGGFVVILGGKTNGIWTFLASCSLAFFITTFCIWCKYGIWENAGVG